MVAPRTTRRRWIGGAALAVGLGLAAALALSLAETPAPARAEGVSWSELTLDRALASAGERGGRVLVKFDADWCTYCRTLEREVLDTLEGAEIFEGLVAVRFDFDDEANRSLVERFVVLGLPTVLVLTADGTQVGRIQGYESREAWIAEAREAVVAEDPIPRLRAELAARPEDPARMLELGEALLVRGMPDEGESLLERVALLPSAAASEASANALFLLGRYYHRPLEDPRTARHIWRELALRHPRSEHAAGAWWWYARALAEIDRVGDGARALAGWARREPENVEAASMWGRYLVDRSVDEGRAEARAAVERVLPRATEEERAELRALLTDLEALPAGSD